MDSPAVVADIADIAMEREPPVLVHGGRRQIGCLASELGRTPEYLRSVSGATFPRTDAEAMDTLLLSLAGRVKPMLVTAFGLRGVRTVGLTGLDGGLVRGVRKHALKVERDGRRSVLRDDMSGRIDTVQVDILDALAAAGVMPVVSPPILGPRGPLNVDADRVAAAIAAAVRAKVLVILTGVGGVQCETNGVVEVVRRGSDPMSLMNGAVDGMRPKLRAAAEALDAGVDQVIIGCARVDQPVRRAIAGDNGTVFERRESPAS